VLEGHKWLDGAGLWIVPVEHEGNRNSSAEEAEVVARIVEGLLKPEVKWFGALEIHGLEGRRHFDCSALQRASCGFVCTAAEDAHWDGGQISRQEAPVVIYSLTTSSPEDAAARDGVFVQLDRLNVATSRAMTTDDFGRQPKALRAGMQNAAADATRECVLRLPGNGYYT